jgi:hypothetical protein
MRNGSLFDSYEEDTEIDEDAKTIRDAIDQADVDNVELGDDEDDGNFEVYNEELFEDEEDELI